MSSFKSALAIARAHPIYLLVYLVLLSLLGVFLVLGDVLAAGGDEGMDEEASVTMAEYASRVTVIDRDGTELSAALEHYLGEHFELVAVADAGHALQDALATSAVDCVLIVPAGAEEALLDAARSGYEEDMPQLEAAWGVRPAAGALVSQEASRWLSLAAQAAALEPGAGVGQVAKLVSEAATERGEVSTAEAASETTVVGVDLFLMYLKFCSYALCSTVTVCAGVVLAAFGRTGIRARLAVGPVPSMRRATGVLATCAVLTLASWTWICAVGLASCRALIGDVDPACLAGAVLCLLVFAFVPLALAFALAQAGATEGLLNAVGNIGGLCMSFLAGAWVPLELMGSGVQAAARLTPAYWAFDAIEVLLKEGLEPDAVLRVASDLGVVALFAVAFACVGFAAGRARLRRRAA